MELNADVFFYKMNADLSLSTISNRLRLHTFQITGEETSLNPALNPLLMPSHIWFARGSPLCCLVHIPFSSGVPGCSSGNGGSQAFIPGSALQFPYPGLLKVLQVSVALGWCQRLDVHKTCCRESTHSFMRDFYFRLFIFFIWW